MAEQLIRNEMAQFSVKYRAVCEDDSYKGEWRSNVDEAYADASNHRKIPGNENHVIDIVAKQSIKMRYIDPK